MINNGNFEADWGDEKSHVARVFTESGDYRAEIENIFTPPGWVAWFYHDPDRYDQPEVRDAWKAHDERRVRSGDKAILLFTFYRRHDAGFYQQVEVEQGQRLRFTAWAHAWSNHLSEDEGGDPDDGRWSDGAGKGVVAWPVSNNLPHDTGDPQTDAKPNFSFWVGIDPTGGTNPSAPSVVWSDGYHIYNGYCQELSVEATAEADTVTVFLRSKTLWPFKHNDAYWDDAALVVVEDEPDEPPEPPPDDDEEEVRGLPRAQYERTYVLLPPGAGVEWALAVINATWDEHRYTLGGSADDAGIGDLDARHIIAVNPDGWPGELAAFFVEWYPGVQVRYVYADTPDQLARILSLPEPISDFCLCQRDERWREEHLGDASCTLTIGEAGCYITCAAEAQKFYGIRAAPTPLTVQHELGWDGFDGCLARHSAIETHCGLQVSTMATGAAHDWLDAGNCAMIEVSPTSLQHFVLAVERTVDDDGADDYIVCNPWTGEQGYLSEMYEDVESWRKLEPITTAPAFKAGLHDLAGADWMLSNSVKGVALAHITVGSKARPGDYRSFVSNDIAVYLRLNWGYAGTGTVPPPEHLEAWLLACADTVNRSKGLAGVILGNEINNPAEWPGGWPNPAYVVSPEYYAALYNTWVNFVTVDTPLTLAPLDPYNVVAGQFGVEPDPMLWAKYFYERCSRIDFIALHAKTQGAAVEEIIGEASYGTFTDAPLVRRYLHLRTLEDQLSWIPDRLRDRPVLVTELNPQRRFDGSLGWDDNGAEWVQAAFDYVRGLGLAGAMLYRFEEAGDQAAFGLINQGDVLATLKE